MDYPTDKEEETVFVDGNNLIPDDSEAESNILKQLMKEQKPAPLLPERRKCEYELLREQVIEQRIKEMGESGLWSTDELKEFYPEFFSKTQ
jgi:hypothetical protein